MHFKIERILLELLQFFKGLSEREWTLVSLAIVRDVDTLTTHVILMEGMR